MKIVKTLFGGTDDSAQEAQIAANREARRFIEEKGAQSRGDVLALAPGAEANRNLGVQSALDILAQTIPQQFSTFQQGNTGAQAMLLAGLPQIQNAILGRQVDLSALQPQTINVDTSFANQQVPDFTSISDLLPQQPQQRPEFNFAQFLRGIRA